MDLVEVLRQERARQARAESARIMTSLCERDGVTPRQVSDRLRDKVAAWSAGAVAAARGKRERKARRSSLPVVGGEA